MKAKSKKNELPHLQIQAFLAQAAKLVEQIREAAAGHGLHDQLEHAAGLLASQELDDVLMLQMPDAGQEERRER